MNLRMVGALIVLGLLILWFVGCAGHPPSMNDVFYGRTHGDVVQPVVDRCDTSTDCNMGKKP